MRNVRYGAGSLILFILTEFTILLVLIVIENLVNMYISKSIYTFLVAGILSVAGCGSGSESNAPNVNRPVPNTAVSNVSTSNNAVETTKKPVAETTNNAPTFAPVIQAYYDALRKKDDAALREILSAAYLAKVSADMKKDKKTGMAAYLAEYDTIPDKSVEVRNEKITGDKAVAEIKGGAYMNWTGVGFVNEGGKWKITGESSDITNVTSAPEPKTAK